MAIVSSYYDINSVDYRGRYLFNPFVVNYETVAIDMLCLVFPSLSREEIKLAVDDAVVNRIVDAPVKVDNNYKKQQVDTTLLDLAKYILSREPIMTSYGVLYKRHGEVPNPVYDLIDSFIKERKKLKKEMFKYPKGTEMFEKFNLLQLLEKINANGFYGLVKQSLYKVICICKSHELLGRACAA